MASAMANARNSPLLPPSLSPLLLLLLPIFTPEATAHPVPKSNHDRTIVVKLESTDKPEQVLIRVEYRLEVDPATVILEDMKPFQDEIDVTRFKNKLDYFDAYTRIYAPILADRIIAKQNGKMLEFACTARTATLKDEKGEPLDHLRCDFVFEATADCNPDKENSLILRETNYQEQEGVINLSLATRGKIAVFERTEPDAEVKARAANERQPGDDAKLRTVQARYRLDAQTTAASTAPSSAATPANPAGAGEHDTDLLHLFLNSEIGFWLLLLLAAQIGAVHALTPGHGKTLMAAYLVGERGTTWHAILLGLVTALTHTSVVLIIALGLRFLPADMSESVRRSIQTGLGLVMGLAIACLGFYLLLARLSGRADHIHLGGGHHHHGHHHHGHSHTHKLPDKVSTWGLIVMGMSGGLIPCWDAIAMLVMAVGMNLFWLALPMLIAFSAGLAGVLVLIGILVVKFRGFAGSRWGEGRLVRMLPIISAVLVTGMGIWLCYEAVGQ